MKRIIIFVAVCINLGLLSVSAQSYSIVNPDSVSHNFYERETVRGNTITFQVDYSLKSLYRISNVNNTRIGQFMIPKDGYVPKEPISGSLEMVSLTPVYQAFLSTFTPEEIRVLAQNDDVLRVGYALSENGAVLEIGFSMYRDRPHLYNIPPQYLEKLETMLKASVRYNIPEVMRERLRHYNVITTIQNISFKGLLDQLP